MKVPLLTMTPPGWADVALADLPRFLQDHAACERKAAAQCMALVGRYPDRPWLVETMTALAREELSHFLQVFRHMQRLGIPLAPDEPDPYVAKLRRGLRTDPKWELIDRLLIAAMIEARSAERLWLISEALTEEPLRGFYANLAREEEAHFKVFTDLARRDHDSGMVDHAIDRWLGLEDEASKASAPRAAVH